MTARQFLNAYVCPVCGHGWHDVWDSGVCDSCPACSTRDVTPLSSTPLEPPSPQMPKQMITLDEIEIKEAVAYWLGEEKNVSDVEADDVTVTVSSGSGPPVVTASVARDLE